MTKLLYLGQTSVNRDAWRVPVPHASEVPFLVEGRELSFVPDQKFWALSATPEQLGFDDFIDSPFFAQSIETIRDEHYKIDVKNDGGDIELPIPKWARFTDENSTGQYRDIRSDEELHLVCRCDRDETPREIFFLTYPEFFLGVKYYNDDVEWIGKSDARRKEEGFHRVHEWLGDVGKPIPVRLDTCDDIWELFGGVDDLMQQSVRNLDGDARTRIHRRLVSDRFETPKDSVTEQLQYTRRLKSVAEETSVGLEIRISEDRDEIEYQTADGKRVTVSNPELLWDCSCHGDGRSYSKAYWREPPESRCPIHGDPHGEQVSAKFTGETIRIDHRGIEFFWRNCDVLRPPSMDTLWFYETITDQLDDHSVRSVLDIGSGTGFLATALASDHESIREVITTDWLLQPTVLSAVNLAANSETIAARTTSSRPEFGTSWATDHDSCPVDICVCDPPSLPAVAEYPTLDYDRAVSGTRLLTEVLRNANRLGTTVYVNFSEVAQREVEEVCELDDVAYEEIGRRPDTPFRIPSALQHDEYRTELIDRGLTHNPTERHPYRHDIIAAKVTPLQSKMSSGLDAGREVADRLDGYLSGGTENLSEEEQRYR